MTSATFQDDSLTGSGADSAAYADACRFLFERINYETAAAGDYQASDLKLERMRRLLDEIGSPHTAIPAIHIAGSKGKGSTAAMVAAALQQAGVRTGLYTSPHLERFEERMRVGGQLPPVADVVAAVDRVRSATERMERCDSALRPTFFEAVTATAWLVFQQAHAQCAVLEVGLGGRLDTTNLCAPLVTAVTSISRDHTRLLGDTLGEIAAEKCGIFKPSIPVVSGVQGDEPRQVVVREAGRTGCRLWEVDRDIRIRGRREWFAGGVFPQVEIDVDVAGQSWRRIPVPLPGRHQERNVAVALGILTALQRQGSSLAAGGAACERAVRHAWAKLDWPLRTEVILRDPLVIVDAAHNPASIAALVETIAPLPQRPRVFVLAISRDKEAAAMVSELEQGRFDHVIVTGFTNNPRAMECESLAQIVRAVHPRVRVAPTSSDAVDQALQLAGADGLVIVSGSFFLAAEVRARLAAHEAAGRPYAAPKPEQVPAP